MTAIFQDSFDHYATADITRKWTAIHTASSGTISIVSGGGRNGTSCLRSARTSTALQNNERAQVSLTLSSAEDVLIVGVAFRADILLSNFSILELRDTGSRQIEVRVNDSQQLYVTRSGALLGTASGIALSVGTWYYLELKATISNTVGAVDLRVNGVTYLSLSNIDTQNTANASVNQVYLGPEVNPEPGGSQQWSYDFDDLVILNNAGSENNDFLGDVRVQAILPDGAGNYAQWTPTGAATNREAVDDATPDHDTTYVSSSTAGQKDAHTFGNLTPTSGTVKWLSHVILHRKDDAGSRTIRPLERISGTDYFGGNVTVGDTYQYSNVIRETSPATASAWTIDEINGAEFGYELVS